MQVRYFDEFKWVDTGDGGAFQFQDADGESFAEVAIHNFDLKLWRWEVRLPARYRLGEVQPCGVVVGALPAKRVCELILCNTIVTRPVAISPAASR